MKDNKGTVQQSAKKIFKTHVKLLSDPTALLLLCATIYHDMLMTVQLLL